MQGIHARHMLVVLAEASGIPGWLWEAADTLMTGEHARMLAIGKDRALEPWPLDDRSRLGVDVARFGRDETVIYLTRGPVVRIVHRAAKADTMAIAGAIVLKLREHWPATAVVDEAGVGGGVLDRLREQDLDVTGFNAAERAGRPTLREPSRRDVLAAPRRFERGHIDLDPLDDDLAAQLGAIKCKLDSAGRIFIES